MGRYRVSLKYGDSGDWQARGRKLSVDAERRFSAGAGASFRLALAGCENSRMARRSRLKGGCRQDCLPH